MNILIGLSVSWKSLWAFPSQRYKMSEQSATSSPSLSNSTSPSSPDIQTLHLDAVSEEDKLEAARLKSDANKAFTCEIPHQVLWI